MKDLHNRFRSLDDIPAPDLWREAENRAQALDQRGVRTLSWTLIALMLVLALAISGAALIGSGIVKLPALVDESANPSPTADALPSGSAAPVESAGPARWTATGSMVRGRAYQTATLLLDGSVLVASGFDKDASSTLGSAELYDPRAGTWVATGSMIEGRYYGHTATRLLDGRVLVAGGTDTLNSGLTLASAELYDQARGRWTPTGRMVHARSGFTATLLLDGRVLVAGGYDSGNGGDRGLLTSAELYDPRTGTWTSTGDLQVVRGGHTATLLGDGKVLVTGGSANDANRLASSELYDPTTGKWVATGSLNVARDGLTATLLSDGKVLVAGGFSYDAGNIEAVDSAELYDPNSGTWTPTGSMIEAGGNHTATLLPTGMVLVAGGTTYTVNGASVAVASAELYDPITETWTITANMEPRFGGFTATLLLDGTVLAAGGDRIGDAPAILAFAELYRPASGGS